ncbi:hypothetical protein ACVXG7_09115 [Enterobacter hormaechei]
MFRLIVHAAVREDILSLPAGVYQEAQKTPSAELRLALKRQQEMLDEQEDY